MSDRFSGVINLYGEDNFNKISNSHIAVIGIGGVGSWSAESLVRSGVGKITLIDLDEICISNTNRQIHALTSNLGKSKIQVMGQRLKEINPELELNLIDDFYSKKTSEQILTQNFDYIIDAIDSIESKVHLLLECKRRDIPVIVIGASGGKTDPTRIHITDVNRSEQDLLLSRLRTKLKREHGFKTKGSKTYGLPCVCSAEPINKEKIDENFSSSNCENGLGSVSHITASFGFMAASWVINNITKDT